LQYPAPAGRHLATSTTAGIVIGGTVERRSTPRVDDLGLPPSARGRVVSYAARGQNITVAWAVAEGTQVTSGLTVNDLYAVPEP
jgi:hypothetical protein